VGKTMSKNRKSRKGPSRNSSNNTIWIRTVNRIKARNSGMSKYITCAGPRRIQDRRQGRCIRSKNRYRSRADTEVS
jgi:hypothetical protein